jgi:SAM-dependent methyltransferase
MDRPSLTDWFRTPLGRAVLQREQQVLDEVLADIFGYHAVQVGLPALPLLRASRIAHRLAVGAYPPAQVLALGHELPFASQTIDLVLLPHVLEFAESPHAILREVDRVLVPEGRLVLTGFNPWSLWGLRQALDWSREQHPWDGNFISLPRAKDWLALLGMEVSAGRLWHYGLPVQSRSWRERLRFLEPAGDRWWGVAGGVYMLEAIKRVSGMRLIAPRWQTVTRARAIAPAVRTARAAND